MLGRPKLSVQVPAAAGAPAEGGRAAAGLSAAETLRLAGSPLSYEERRARRAARSSAKHEKSRRLRQYRKCLIVGSVAVLGFLREPEICSLAGAHLVFAPLGRSAAQGQATGLSKWLAPLQRFASCQRRYVIADVGRCKNRFGGGSGETRSAANYAVRRTISSAQLSSLCRRGFVVVDNFVAAEDIEAARRRVLDDKGITWRIPTNSRDTRDDKIAWLVDSAATTRRYDDGESDNKPALLAAEQSWFRDLRAQLCSRVHLTTKCARTGRRSPDEFQLAVYRSGARGYTRHLDAEESVLLPEGAFPTAPILSPGSPRVSRIKRVVTAVLYLNARDISADVDGGELRLWPPAYSGEPCRYSEEDTVRHVVDVPPKGGTLVLFFSGAVPHQVRKIKRGAAPRIALTAWFHGSPGDGIL